MWHPGRRRRSPQQRSPWLQLLGDFFGVPQQQKKKPAIVGSARNALHPVLGGLRVHPARLARGARLEFCGVAPAARLARPAAPTPFEMLFETRLATEERAARKVSRRMEREIFLERMRV